jgi:hypothetical protein
MDTQRESSEPAVYGAVNIDPWGQPRIGDWIQTRTGVKFHLLDTRPEDFSIEDIAHALANQCRFTGHTRKFYSVAEHSVRVATLVASKYPNSTYFAGGKLRGPRDLVYAALMHDASEAYITDVARPFKQLPEFAFYREAEESLMQAISAAFRFDHPMPKQVKYADEVLLGTEARDLMAPVIDGWHFRYDHLPQRIRPWSARKAKRRFLAMFYRVNTIGARRPGSRLVSVLWPNREAA